jgi:hypothetical protein
LFVQNVIYEGHENEDIGRFGNGYVGPVEPFALFADGDDTVI